MTDSVDVSEQWYTTKHSNTDLLLRIWNPKSTPLHSLIIFVHGFGEHSARYSEFFKPIAEDGIKVISFDQRGHGETAKKINKLGSGSGFNVLFKDINEIIDNFYDPKLNLILMGHSYGGLAVFNYSLYGDKRNLINGLIGCSPAFELPQEVLPHPVKLFVLKRLVHLLPNHLITTDIDPSQISRKEDEVKLYISDPLVTPISSLVYANDLLNKGSVIIQNGAKIQIPNVLIAHGTADKITLSRGSQQVYDNMKTIHPNVTLKLYDGAYHELHKDLCCDEVSKDYIDWINNLKPKVSPTSKL